MLHNDCIDLIRQKALPVCWETLGFLPDLDHLNMLPITIYVSLYQIPLLHNVA